MAGPRSVEISITPFDSPRVIGTVRKRLTEAVDDRTKHLTQGLAKDWGDYQRRLGRLEGVREGLEILDAVELENSK